MVEISNRRGEDGIGNEETLQKLSAAHGGGRVRIGGHLFFGRVYAAAALRGTAADAGLRPAGVQREPGGARAVAQAGAQGCRAGVCETAGGGTAGPCRAVSGRTGSGAAGVRTRGEGAAAAGARRCGARAAAGRVNGLARYALCAPPRFARRNAKTRRQMTVFYFFLAASGGFGPGACGRGRPALLRQTKGRQKHPRRCAPRVMDPSFRLWKYGQRRFERLIFES